MQPSYPPTENLPVSHVRPKRGLPVPVLAAIAVGLIVVNLVLCTALSQPDGPSADPKLFGLTVVTSPTAGIGTAPVSTPRASQSARESARQERSRRAEQRRVRASQRAERARDRQRRALAPTPTRKRVVKVTPPKGVPKRSSEPTAGVPRPPVKPARFKNCPAMRKVYPNGVPAGHPAYERKHDRDKDGRACEASS